MRHRASGRPDTDGLRRLVLVAALAGVLVGVVWSALAPWTAAHADPNEAQASVDGTLAGLELLAGLITAAALAWRPGRSPAVRAGLALLAVTGAAFLSWAVGAALRAPRLHAIGVVLLWPLAAAVVTAIRVTVTSTFRE